MKLKPREPAGEVLWKSLIRVTGGNTIAPNENQNKNLEAKR